MHDEHVCASLGRHYGTRAPLRWQPTHQWSGARAGCASGRRPSEGWQSQPRATAADRFKRLGSVSERGGTRDVSDKYKRPPPMLLPCPPRVAHHGWGVCHVEKTDPSMLEYLRRNRRGHASAASPRVFKPCSAAPRSSTPSEGSDPPGEQGFKTRERAAHPPGRLAATLVGRMDPHAHHLELSVHARGALGPGGLRRPLPLPGGRPPFPRPWNIVSQKRATSGADDTWSVVSQKTLAF